MWYWGEKGNKAFWFEKNEDGNAVLVRPDGTKKVETRKMEHFMISNQCHEGWQRSVLLSEEYKWGGTDFAVSVNTLMAFYPWKKKDGTETVLVFSSCQAAERHVYPYLGKRTVEKCRENVEAFYKDPNLQASWPSMILHPICLEVNLKTKRFKPIPIKELGYSDGFLNWMKMDWVGQIKSFEQYEFFLEQYKEEKKGNNY